jgi:hypothetical protein
MSRQTDRTEAITAAGGVAVVALTAAVISFSHVRRLALEAGETELAAWLLPISIDGAIVAAVAVILADSRAGRRPAGLTWLLLLLGLSSSLAANIASAEPTLTARAVAAWPPLALALGIEVLAGLARRRNDVPGSDTAAAGQPAADRPSPDQAAAPRGDRLPAAAAASGNNGLPPAAIRQALNGSGRATGRRQLSDSEAVTLIRQLDAAAPDGLASRMQIQQRVGCGGSKAARLAALARADQPASVR